ncbi:anti-sigma factor [Pelagibius sp. Alg239-R121]|uniref:anti-sigma factor family protein n=1 Tax=Pelagibius sp. Alg239-R121 TaxID=2993448 RepID=UPI0024A6A525|nr:zf-HC2 domain-containing protein [Pelagibius sp. Alg239-R121]
MTAPRKTIKRRIHGTMFKLPLMITCNEFEDFVLAYLEEELPAHQCTIFKMHLKVCRECREYLRAYEASMTLTKASLKTEETDLPESVPQDLVAAVLAARNA